MLQNYELFQLCGKDFEPLKNRAFPTENRKFCCIAKRRVIYCIYCKVFPYRFANIQ